MAQATRKAARKPAANRAWTSGQRLPKTPSAMVRLPVHAADYGCLHACMCVCLFDLLGLILLIAAQWEGPACPCKCLRMPAVPLTAASACMTSMPFCSMCRCSALSDHCMPCLQTMMCVYMCSVGMVW